MIRRLLLGAAIAVALSSCGQSSPPQTAGVECQSRLSDARIVTALSSMNGNAVVALQGVKVDCNEAFAVYVLANNTFAQYSQLLGADNGKWFVLNGTQATEVQ